MPDFRVLEPALDLNNRIGFLLDWELTQKCNLDCSYCSTGLYGGHDNSTSHPEYQDCIETVDFMLEYVDIYMSKKVKGIRYVTLNVYGGESLHHPRIVEILTYIDQARQAYQNKWNLTVTVTTNAILTPKKLSKIIPFVDEFTCSYHSESTEKQQAQFKDNLLIIKNSGKRLKCVVMMHNDPALFGSGESLIEWCKIHDIKCLPKPFDNFSVDEKWKYKSQQIIWFNDYYQKKKSPNAPKLEIQENKEIINQGRACCGGRQMCLNGEQRSRSTFVPNKFRDWYCSVNEFFLYVKQRNGEIFVNKDCKMNFEGSISAIGNLSDKKSLLEFTKKHLDIGTMPIIQCKKNQCLCGLCVPKAQTLDDFTSIMEKYRS